MLVLALAVLAQSQISLQIGTEKRDSIDRAKRDSIEMARERRIDSLHANQRARDSVRQQTRVRKQIPVTAALSANAFKDASARDLLLRARAARLRQDSSLTSYDARGYARISVGMKFKRIGRDRLLMRAERASRVMWQRGNGAIVDVTGQRAAFPMIEGVGRGNFNLVHEIGDIPYVPGRETLWIGSGLAKARVDENELIHPLAEGAEAYYTYSSGDSISFQLPGGKRVALRELRIRARQPKWNVGVGSLWFDASTGHLVRAVYRMAQEMDIMAAARESGEEEDPEGEIPRWVKPMILPMKANVSAVTVEYGLHEGRFWLPRAQTIEGDAQVGFMRIPFKLEQRFTYVSVNGGEPVEPIVIAATDTATDSVSRAARRDRRRVECESGTDRVRRQNRDEENLRILVRIPCDTAALARSPDLPGSIYDEGESVFGSAERDALVAEALTLGAQPEFSPLPARFSYGLSYTRFNRIEGLSTGFAIDKVLGDGYSARTLARIGVADWSPNAEAAIERTDGRRRIGAGVYRRLVAANDWGDPLGFSSSLSALVFGRDEGFYYRTWGAELTGEGGKLFTRWRLFGEQQFDASVRTEFALAHPKGVRGDLTNIDALNGNVVGLAVTRHASYGLDPHGFRALTDVKLEGATGTFDYSRGLLQTTLSSGLGGLDAALTLGGGTSGGHLPIQKNFFVGGVGTVRGQRAGAAVGSSFWMASAELGTRNTGFRKIIFGDLGWAGPRTDFAHPGRPLSAVGVGASFMDGLIRLDLARGIYPEKAVRANLYVEARF